MSDGLIINTAAVHGRHRAQLERLARAHLGNCRIAPTEKPGDVQRLAFETCERGARRLVVAGGDGTVHEAACAPGGRRFLRLAEPATPMCPTTSRAVSDILVPRRASMMSRTCPAAHMLDNLNGRARQHLTMAIGFLLTTAVVWACNDPRTLGLYALYFMLAHLCYE